MKKKTLLLWLVLGTSIAYGQEFNRAVGVRGGWSSGIEYRHFLTKDNSVRLLLSSRQRGFQLHGLYEFHRTGLFSFTDQLEFVFGAGLHAGYRRWDEIRTKDMNQYTEVMTKPLAGVDGLAGLEYSIIAVPLTFGLEVKPYFDIGGRNGFTVIPWDFAFTIRYLF